MIYIILSNVGMALMMLVIYLRYSHFRISSLADIKQLQKKSDTKSEEIKMLNEKLFQTTKIDNDKIQLLMAEIDGLRKEKENEIKLRLTAEKQIEGLMQKNQDIEKKSQEIAIIQETIAKESKDTMYKIGNDLFKKLNDSYKQEVETNKNLIGRISKSITEMVEKISFGGLAGSKIAKKKALIAQKLSEKDEKSPDKDKKEDNKTEQLNIVEVSEVEDPSKKLVSDLIDTMKASGHMANKDYFLPSNFDEQKAKLLLCEVAFVGKGKLSIIDFKACKILAEYESLQQKDKNVAQDHLKQKLDKYLAYLNNPKYKDTINKVMSSTKTKYEKVGIIIALPSKKEIQAMKEIRYYEKASQLGIEVHDFDGVNNVVI